MTLPLQTGSAIIGARVLSADARKAAGERDQVGGAGGKELAEELGARPSAAQPTSTWPTSSFTIGQAVVKDSADAPGGKEVVGGELMSTADWAPQQSVARRPPHRATARRVSRSRAERESVGYLKKNNSRTPRCGAERTRRSFRPSFRFRRMRVAGSPRCRCWDEGAAGHSSQTWM